jgi:hypothetical protein
VVRGVGRVVRGVGRVVRGVGRVVRGVGRVVRGVGRVGTRETLQETQGFLARRKTACWAPRKRNSLRRPGKRPAAAANAALFSARERVAERPRFPHPTGLPHDPREFARISFSPPACLGTPEWRRKVARIHANLRGSCKSVLSGENAVVPKPDSALQKVSRFAQPLALSRSPCDRIWESRF